MAEKVVKGNGFSLSIYSTLEKEGVTASEASVQRGETLFSLYKEE